MSDDKHSYINGARLDLDPESGRVVMSPERQAQLRPLQLEMASLVVRFDAAIELRDELELRGVLIEMGYIARRVIGAQTEDES